MKTLCITRRYNKPVLEVRSSLESLIETLQARFKGRYEWQGNTLCFTWKRAAGEVVIKQDTVTLELRLPITLAPFANRIETFIEDYLSAHNLFEEDTEENGGH